MRLSGGDALAKLHERFSTRTGVHGAGCSCYRIRRGVYRLPGRERLDVGEHCHQRNSDLRADRVLGDGHRIPHEPSARKRGLSVRLQFGRRVHLPVRDSQANRRRQASRRYRPRCRWDPQAHAGRCRQAGAVQDRLSRGGRQGHVPESSERRLRGRDARFRLSVRPGNHRHSDSGRIRIGDCDGRRGEESRNGTYQSR